MNKRTMVRARRCALGAGLTVLMAPGAADAKLGDRTLKIGDRGRDVKTAQRYLTRAGVRTTADGVYGRSTARRVKRFERLEDRRVNGRLSPADARALKRAARRGGTSGGGNGGAAAGQAPAAEGGATEKAVLSSDGRTAIAPESAPQPVKDAIAAANRITRKPYRYGGGHGSFEDSGYDCSGAVSYALHGGDLLDRPLDSSSLMRWGKAGRGEWITVYAHGGHTYVMIAGLRFDTSGRGEKGPRWRQETRSTRGFTARHPQGL
jgi:cell wall-associated NlpC family hydrolase